MVLTIKDRSQIAIVGKDRDQIHITFGCFVFLFVFTSVGYISQI